MEQYGIVTGTSTEYTNTDLDQLAKNDLQKDYVAVIKDFVKQELKQEISYLDTVDGTFNPRSVVVGTTQGDIYLIELQKWYNHNGIWAVSRYAQYKDQMAVPKKEAGNQEFADPSDITDAAIQEQVKEKIAARKEGHFYFTTDENLYILLVAGKDQSVELLHVYGNEDNATLLDIEYTYIDSKNKKFGENPYVLLKADSSIADLFFKKHSGVQIDDVRVNMP